MRSSFQQRLYLSERGVVALIAEEAFPSGSRLFYELSLYLLQTCLVYINTLLIQRVLAEPEWRDRLIATIRRAMARVLAVANCGYTMKRLGNLNSPLPWLRECWLKAMKLQPIFAIAILGLGIGTPENLRMHPAPIGIQ